MQWHPGMCKIGFMCICIYDYINIYTYECICNNPGNSYILAYFRVKHCASKSWIDELMSWRVESMSWHAEKAPKRPPERPKKTLRGAQDDQQRYFVYVVLLITELLVAGKKQKKFRPRAFSFATRARMWNTYVDICVGSNLHYPVYTYIH